jgi:non-heme chloroperoxidase
MIKGATLKIYKGAPHGLMTTHKDQFNTDLLEFARQQPEAEVSARREASTGQKEIRP